MTIYIYTNSTFKLYSEMHSNTIYNSFIVYRVSSLNSNTSI